MWELSAMNIMEAREVSKTYWVGPREITVLDRISLAVEQGEFVVVRGTSGSGKSTLLTILSGLDRPTSGKVYMEGQDITGLSEAELAPWRNAKIGFVFQSFHLIPSLNALENIMFPAELHRDRQARSKAQELMARAGILDRAENFPHQLSGGEKQRVAICRALINRPRILFADEPTGNLDSVNGEAVMSLLMELHREQSTTLVVVTHNPQIAQAAPHVIELRDGRVVPREAAS